MSEIKKIEQIINKLEKKSLTLSTGPSLSSSVTTTSAKIVFEPELSFNMGFNLYQLKKSKNALPYLEKAAELYNYPPAFLIVKLIYENIDLDGLSWSSMYDGEGIKRDSQKIWTKDLRDKNYKALLGHQKWFEQQAKKNALGIYYLALFYNYVLLDLEKANALYLEAANAGLALAQYRIYYTQRDLVSGNEFLKAAAAQNFPAAQNQLALDYEYGTDFLIADSKKTLPLYTAAALQGFGAAIRNLAYYYTKQKNYSNALFWYEKGVAQNESHSLSELPVLLNQYPHLADPNRFYKVCKAANNEEAFFTILYKLDDKKIQFKWLHCAAKQGSANAQYELGIKYLDGKGIAKDLKNAEIFLEMAANQGFKSAQQRLAYFYYDNKNLAKAIIWHEKIAAQCTDGGVPHILIEILIIEPDLANPSRFYNLCLEHDNTETYFQVARFIPGDTYEAWCAIAEKEDNPLTRASSGPEMFGLLSYTSLPEDILCIIVTNLYALKHEEARSVYKQRQPNTNFFAETATSTTTQNNINTAAQQNPTAASLSCKDD